MIPAPAILLAGGASSRMGQPKAWLPFGGRPLLAHLVERLADQFTEVVVVAAPEMELPESSARVVADRWPGEGPLPGLLTGLGAIESHAAFVASCDLPLLDAGAAAALVEMLGEEFDAVVPRVEDRLHPLHAAYRRAPVLDAGERLVASGVRRPVALFDQVRTLILPEESYALIDPHFHSVMNINRPEEYEAALEIWSRLEGGGGTQPG